MSKNQALGGIILAVCIIVAVGYIILVGAPSYLGLDTATVRLDAVLILVSIAFIVILAIGAWLGYTMATTPPPKPIEPKPIKQITTETKKETETKNKTQKQTESEDKTQESKP